MPVKYKPDEIQIKRGRDGTQTKTIKRFYNIEKEKFEFIK